MLKNLSSAAVVIGTLRVKQWFMIIFYNFGKKCAVCVSFRTRVMLWGLSNGLVWQRDLMRGSWKFWERGFRFFLAGEGIEDPNTTINRPSSAHQKTPFKWRFAGWPMMAQTLNAGLEAMWFFRGSGPVLLRNPIFLWFFRGFCPPPPPPPPPMDLWSEVYWYWPYMPWWTRKLHLGAVKAGCWGLDCLVSPGNVYQCTVLCPSRQWFQQKVWLPGLST